MILHTRFIRTVLLITIFISLPIFAQVVNITGTVVDSATGSGIVNAQVSIIEMPQLTAKTAANGTFTIGNSAVRMLGGSGHSVLPHLLLEGSTLSLTDLSGTSPVTVDVYTTKGVRVYHAVKSAGSDGTVRFGVMWRSKQLYQVKVAAGSRTFLFSTMGMMSTAMSATAAGTSRLAKTAATTYTVRIAIPGRMSRTITAVAATGNVGTIRLISVGNPAGTSVVPVEGGEGGIANPTTVVGTGTAASCTPDAFITALAKGGIITFNSGNEPVTITMVKPAKVFNDKLPDIVIDGGGLVTLSGGGTSRIIYMNTCDQSLVWTTPNCDDQPTPRLTVQNLTFTQASSKTETEFDGGGAIWERGGRIKVVNCRFFNNECAGTGPDLGGGAIRVLDQSKDLPVYVTWCTFGGTAGKGNIGANGGALSSIDVSWTITNSLFSYNEAIGRGGNPATAGTPGGGSGGAIYNDGNTMTLSINGCLFEYNKVNAYGSAIFFVTNNHTGDIKIDKTVSRNNIGGSWYPVYPGISMHADTKIVVTGSTLQ